MNQLISVIVPVYNVEKYLLQCVDSILSQTYDNIQVILVDDGSTDASSTICDEYACKDNRVEVIHKTNGGLSSARNAGIDAARGEYIIFIDSDDYWASNGLLQSAVENCMGENLVIWKYQHCGEHETVLLQSTSWDVRRFSIDIDYKYLLASGTIVASACFMAIPTQWFRDGSLHFKMGEVSEDVEWFAKVLSLSTEIILLDAPLYVYRVRSSSISNTVSEKTLYNMYNHILWLKEFAEQNQKDVLKYYLAEQTANYIIVLSRSVYDSDDVKNAKELVPLLHYSLRKRSKVIAFISMVFGVPAAIRVLNLIDREKKR